MKRNKRVEQRLFLKIGRLLFSSIILVVCITEFSCCAKIFCDRPRLVKYPDSFPLKPLLSEYTDISKNIEVTSDSSIAVLYRIYERESRKRYYDRDSIIINTPDSIVITTGWKIDSSGLGGNLWALKKALVRINRVVYAGSDSRLSIGMDYFVRCACSHCDKFTRCQDLDIIKRAVALDDLKELENEIRRGLHAEE
jgi:hypothetical protein